MEKGLCRVMLRFEVERVFWVLKRVFGMFWTRFRDRREEIMEDLV